MFVSSKHDVVFAVSAETRMDGGPADRAASGARFAITYLHPADAVIDDVDCPDHDGG
jgi:hypothetical protein